MAKFQPIPTPEEAELAQQATLESLEPEFRNDLATRFTLYVKSGGTKFYIKVDDVYKVRDMKGYLKLFRTIADEFETYLVEMKYKNPSVCWDSSNEVFIIEVR